MKIRAEILSVETVGDRLSIKAQGSCDADAEWRDLSVISFQVPSSPINRRAYHTGRSLNIKIEVA